MRHELVLLAQRIDWDWIDAKLSEAFSAKGRSATETRFMIGLLLLKQLYDLLARRYAGAGRTIPISSTSPGRASSSTSWCTSGQACPTGVSAWDIGWRSCWWKACGWRATAAR